MGIENIFAWYQQKIGTYDKQKWETKIEQREQRIYGLNHIQTRSTKPNTNLIDIDLVRGSSFTKAKPKHGFIKVTKLATLRCIFLPIYTRWWIKQTSRYVFAVSLFVYISQVLNVFIYFLHTPASIQHSDGLCFMEICVPFVMMWVLSLIHSQIVATTPSPEVNKTNIKPRRFRRRSNLKPKRKSEEKVISNTQEKMCNKNRNEVFNLSQSSPKSDKVKVRYATKSEEEFLNNRNNNCSVSTDSDSEDKTVFKPKRKTSLVNRNKHIPIISITSQDSNCDTEDEVLSSPEIVHQNHLSGEFTSSATDLIGLTTNSEEDCSYSSENDNISDSQIEKERDYSVYNNDLAPTALLTPPSVKVSCIVWERNEIKKADFSMLDISSAIIGKVESMSESMDYFYVGLVFSTILAILPIVCRILNTSTDVSFTDAQHILEDIYANITQTCFVAGKQDTLIIFYRNFLFEVFFRTKKYLYSTANGISWEYFVIVITFMQRWILASMIFFLLAVAEKTFKQRLLYAKLFSHLTSSRRARKSELPHFRLNKVINIKTWLSVRSYLKKRGPQRSVDVIVSTAFIVNLLLLTFLCVEVLKDTVLFSLYYLEALIWCLGLGILLLRFMTLGTKINKKYRNLSVLITEQINLHLQIEQKPHKKDELNVANNVLKLAIDLLKELENPFKISGLSANPILYNVTKLVILSALSGVFSEMLGFKLKFHKIKLK